MREPPFYWSRLFLSYLPPQVQLKRTFLDESSRNRSAGTASLTGEQWCAIHADKEACAALMVLLAPRRYTQTALRAVNQAIGRVIRHRHDFGAVLLADERFAYGGVQSQLSVWLRPHVQRPDSYGKALSRRVAYQPPSFAGFSPACPLRPSA